VKENTYRLLALILGLALVAAALRGEAQLGDKNPLRTDRNPLASVRSLKCRFTVAAAGSWSNGEARAEVKPGQEVTVDIDEIDADGNSARVGSDEVTALLTVSSIHFLNRTLQGSLNVTTVFALKNSNGAYRAVRSGHDYVATNIPGFVSEPNVTQRYGECETR
jgi:hypothetical protein